MIKAPCVVKYHTFQDNNGYVVKTWYIEDAAGEPWADDACESDCREIAAEINNAARYRMALTEIIDTCGAMAVFSHIKRHALQAIIDESALADAGKGGGDAK